MSTSIVTDEQAHTYNVIVRQITWLVLPLILVTTPLNQPQTIPMLVLVGVGVIGNALRHNTWMMSQRWFASRFTLLLFNNLFVAVLLLLVGRIDMAYTGLLGLTIITATFWYGYRGPIILILAQGTILTLAGSGLLPIFAPIAPGAIRSTVLAVGVLLILAIAVERLSRVPRVERDIINRLYSVGKATQARLLAALESTNDATIMVDVAGTITHSNAAFRELIGLKKEFVGQPLAGVLTLQHENDQLVWAHVFQNSPQFLSKYLFTAATGDQIPLNVTVDAIRTERKEIIGYVITCENLSAQQSLGEQQSSFIAIASHELRTPITFIEAALSMALGPTAHVSEQVRPTLEKAHHNTMFVSQLIEDLTTLYTVENGGIHLQLQSIDPKKLVSQAIYDYSDLAQQKGIKLSGEAAAKVPAVLTSEYFVLQILRNLVSNAVKYTESGSVTLKVQSAARGGLLFSIKDTGVGIAKKDQENLFTQFFQAEDYRTREQGGVGIGLYLSAQLAKRINARLWFESELGYGSTFYLEVPPLGGLKKDSSKVLSAGMNNLLEQI